ncbi:MAG: glycosyltransferase family 4 protein [Vicingaceae bacterium]
MKVVYIISKVEKAVAFEWIADAFKEKGENIHFILLHNNFNTPIVNYLEEKGIPLSKIAFHKKLDLFRIWFQVYGLLLKLRPQLVHTHLFEGSLIGLSAAKMARIKKRVYTRHHSTYHHQYFPKAVKYDKWINALATDIVAISNNVKRVLINKEKVAPEKVSLIEHGFKLEQFQCVSQDRADRLRKKYNIKEGKTIVGVISRYFELKGVEYIVKAFKELVKQHPNVHLLLANAGGEHEAVVRAELNAIPKENYSEIKFENDLFALHKLIDIYVHVPINNEIEAFGQTYVEALASGTPSVFTLSGIANDFIKDGQNALVVEAKNSDQILAAIERYIQNPSLREKIVENGKKDVDRFALKHMINKLFNLYQKNANKAH